VWDADKPASSEDLAAVLLWAAVGSGLPNQGEVNAKTVRHSYIAYLVRQGLRLSDLEQITVIWSFTFSQDTVPIHHLSKVLLLKI
jgi:succinoglycan biosynthesis transport protein ExoP